MDHAWHKDSDSLDQIVGAVVRAFSTLDLQEQRAGIALYRLLASYVNLFDSQQAGTTWISTRPGTFLLPVADGFSLAKRYNAARFGAVLQGEPSPPFGKPSSEVA